MTSRSTQLALAVLLIATTLAYWPGLHGPFLLDDTSNLQPIKEWLAGDRTLSQLVLGNASGPLGRPASMLTFAISAVLTGFSPFSFKLGNLVLHLACGTLVCALFSAIRHRDARLSAGSAWLPLVMTSFWLLHPLLVSTVLYSVQRMAILSALFTLAAMLCWWHGRTALERGASRRGWLLIFGAFPALTVLAILSKETGVLAPFLCWVLEMTYFAPKQPTKRPLAARLFVTAGCVVPLLIGFLALLLQPSRLLSGYANREFTLLERLFTESRVLFDYLGSLLLPWGPRLSLFRDDYTISSGLLAPATTALALTAWGGLLMLAWRSRHAMPAFTAGVGLYLVGHALESSAVPLNIYFEHRNYLPSIGAILALTGIATWIAERLRNHMDKPSLVFGAGTLALIFTLTLATHARALVWESKQSLLASSLAHHPNSRALRMEIAQFAMESEPQNVSLAQTQYATLMSWSNPVDSEIGALGLAAVDCYAYGRLKQGHDERILRTRVEVIGPDLLNAIRNVAEIAIARPCTNLPPSHLADRLVAWLDRSPTSESLLTKWHARYLAARLYLAGEGSASSKALEQAKASWHAGQDPAVGAMTINLMISRGHYAEAAHLLREVEQKVPASDRQGRQILRTYAEAIENGTRTSR